MKDFIKEFGDDQSKKNIPVTYEPEEKWGFEPHVEDKPVLKPKEDPDSITHADLKSFAAEVVLKYMNESTLDRPELSQLVFEQRKEIVEKVKLYESRPGFMSMTFHEDKEKDECILGARIDPTNNKDWVLTKEEVVYKLPYSYKDSLYQLFNEVRKKN